MAFLIVLLLILLFIYLLTSRSIGIRESIIQSYLLIFGLTAILTELLSLVDLLTYQFIVSAWLLLNGVVFCLIVYTIKKSGLNLRDLSLIKRFSKISNLSWINRIILFCIGFILIITFIIAISAPPNTYDSMTYHMSRVAHWIQQQSVKYFPTAIERQNYSMPLAEYMILHLQILSRSDRYANLVQWSGFLIAILVVMEIAQIFRLSQTGQLLSALFIATLPMAILQSSSTQNDLLTGTFCLIFVYYLIQTIQLFNWNTVLLTGLALGMAVFTKGTAYIYCAALGLLLGGLSLINKDEVFRKRLFGGFIALVLFALLLNVGIYYRNTKLYSHPLSTENNELINDRIALGVIYANLVRNGAMQIAIPVPDLNDILTIKITDHLGEMISDSVSTFPRAKFRIKFLINEDEAGNLFHFLLLSMMVLTVPWIGKTKNKVITQYAGGIAACVILYSLIFKWQPWGNRLQLPIFMVGAPLIGYGIDRLRVQRILLLIGIIAFSIYSVPYLTLNSTRPLFPVFKKSSPFRSNLVRKFFSNRPELYKDYAELIAPFYKDLSILHTDRQTQYFAGNSSNLKDYQNVMAAVNQIDTETIGLHLGTNHWEYPIWVFANKHASFGSPLFTHIGVVSSSGVLDDDGEELPKYIISTKFKEDDLIENEIYSIVIDTPSITLLER